MISEKNIHDDLKKAIKILLFFSPTAYLRETRLSLRSLVNLSQQIEFGEIEESRLSSAKPDVKEICTDKMMPLSH